MNLLLQQAQQLEAEIAKLETEIDAEKEAYEAKVKEKKGTIAAYKRLLKSYTRGIEVLGVSEDEEPELDATTDISE